MTWPLPSPFHGNWVYLHKTLKRGGWQNSSLMDSEDSYETPAFPEKLLSVKSR